MRKNINKLATLVMTGALAASMSFAAFATTTSATYNSQTKKYEMPVNKKILTDGKTYAPKASFNFKVTPYVCEDAAVESKAFAVNGGTKNLEIKSGVDGAVTVTAADFTSFTSLADDYTSQFKIQVDATKFEDNGVYKYTLKEYSGYNNTMTENENDNYPGMVYDGTEYSVYVFVVTNKVDGVDVKQVNNIVIEKTENNTSTKTDELVNIYGEEDPNHPNDDKVYDLTISKEVAGNMGSHGDTFNISLSVESDVTGGESFKVTKYVEGAAQTDVITLDSTAAEALSLPISEKITYQIDGLTSGDVVSVKEKEAGLDSYETKVTLSAGVAEADANNKIGDTLESTETLKVKVSANDSTLKITNKRDAVTPTGVVMDVAPYALMVALAGGAAATFLRKKESFED